MFNHIAAPLSASFFEAPDTAENYDYCVFGVPYDGTASYRPGSRFAPQAIRAATFGLEWYSPIFDKELEELSFVDIGDLPFHYGDPVKILDMVTDSVLEILELGGRPVMLGGEHSLTPAVVRALVARYNEIAVLQIDAHCDLRKNYLGEPNSHACAMRRCLDYGVELMQFGIRSGPREEWTFVRENDTHVTIINLADRLEALERPLYVTLDIDAFDPSLVKGTGTPEPGGIFWDEFIEVLLTIREIGCYVVGFDCMELAPQLDPSQVSDVVAAKAVRDMMLAFAPV